MKNPLSQSGLFGSPTMSILSQNLGNGSSPESQDSPGVYWTPLCEGGSGHIERECRRASSADAAIGAIGCNPCGRWSQFIIGVLSGLLATAPSWSLPAPFRSTCSPSGSWRAVPASEAGAPSLEILRAQGRLSGPGPEGLSYSCGSILGGSVGVTALVVG